MKKFLLISGVFAVSLSLLGMLKVLGLGTFNSIFGQLWWLDQTENVSHLAIGVICILAAWLFSEKYQRIFLGVFASLAIVVAVYSVVTAHVLKVNLEAPIEEVIYFTLGDWALWVAFKQFKAAPPKAPFMKPKGFLLNK